MANLHDSNTYGRTGYKPLPETFDTDFLNHVNNGLWECGFNPEKWFAELHKRFDSKMGSKENVSRHIIEAISGSEFEPLYKRPA